MASKLCFGALQINSPRTGFRYSYTIFRLNLYYSTKKKLEKCVFLCVTNGLKYLKRPLIMTYEIPWGDLFAKNRLRSLNMWVISGLF